VNGYIDHLHTLLGATSNYSSIANLHTLQISTAPSKPFPTLLCPHQRIPDNGFWQWRFFSFMRTGSVFRASGAELNSQRKTNSQAGDHFTPTSYSSLHMLTFKWLGQIRAEQSRALAYCRQTASTATLGIEPRWDPWPYICSVSRLLFVCVFFGCSSFDKKGGVGLFYNYNFIILHLIPPGVTLK
jgi:hypothetical protein